MSSKEPIKPRDDVLAAREAKKLLKQKAKNKVADSAVKDAATEVKSVVNKSIPTNSNMQKKSVVTKDKPIQSQNGLMIISDLLKTVDEVDRAAVVVKTKLVEVSDKSRDQIKADGAAKKTAKPAKKKVDEEGDVQVSKDLTVKDVVETFNDIVNVAKEVQEVTAKVEAIDLETKKKEEPSKSKAELRAERRAKQEAQRAAKQSSQQAVKQTNQQAAKPDSSATVGDTKSNTKISSSAAKNDINKEKSPKLKSASKAKAKPRCGAIWVPHLQYDNSKEAMRSIPMNSTLHPAVVRLGVQLASRVVAGSSARCIALLDALKKMVSSYSLPARTEAARGLEAALAPSLAYLWRLRAPSASQLNAVKFLRAQLKQLPDDISEMDAKAQLLQEVDRYIREQIGKAGEAISLRVRDKIRRDDRILIYGGSSLIERILSEAHDAGVRFSVVQCAHRAAPGRGTLRRLRERGMPCYYADVTALGCVMRRINKVLLSASALLSNERAVCAAGAALAAAAARRRNVPVLVACETHKFSERIQTDAFIHNELGDMDCLIDDSGEGTPLRELLSTNHNLSTLSMAYDITPQKFITAVVTELAILPCTSTPVVLRFTEMKNANMDYRVNGILGLQ